MKDGSYISGASTPAFVVSQIQLCTDAHSQIQMHVHRQICTGSQMQICTASQMQICTALKPSAPAKEAPRRCEFVHRPLEHDSGHLKFRASGSYPEIPLPQFDARFTLTAEQSPLHNNCRTITLQCRRSCHNTARLIKYYKGRAKTSGLLLRCAIYNSVPT